MLQDHETHHIMKEFREFELMFLKTLEEKYLILDFALLRQQQAILKLIEDWKPYRNTLSKFSPLIEKIILSASKNMKELMQGLNVRLKEISQYLDHQFLKIDCLTKECNAKVQSIQALLQNQDDCCLVFDNTTTIQYQNIPKICISSLVYEPIEQIFITASQDGSIKFYDNNLNVIDDKKEVHQSWIRTICVQYCPFVKTVVLLSAGDDQTIKFWLKQGKQYEEIRGITYSGPKSYVRAVEMMQFEDARAPLVFAGRGQNDLNAINIHKWNDPVPIQRLVHHNSNLKLLKCMPKLDVLMSLDEGGGNVLWSLRTFTKLDVIEKAVCCMDYNQTLQLICFCVPGKLLPQHHLKFYYVAQQMKLLFKIDLKGSLRVVQFLNCDFIATVDCVGQLIIRNFKDKRVVYLTDCSALHRITCMKFGCGRLCICGQNGQVKIIKFDQ